MQLSNDGSLEVGPALLDPRIGLLWGLPPSFSDGEMNLNLVNLREVVLDGALTDGGFDEVDIVACVGYVLPTVQIWREAVRSTSRLQYKNPA